MSVKIKLGANAGDAFSIPISIPVVSAPVTGYSIVDAKHFYTNDPVNGLVVSDDQYAIMLADTELAANLASLIASGFIEVETPE